PSLRKGRGELEQLLESLGGLYTRGLEVDWAGVDGGARRRKVRLPTYPFEPRDCGPTSGAARSVPGPVSDRATRARAEGEADHAGPRAGGEADHAGPRAEGEADHAGPRAEGEADHARPRAEGEADHARPRAEGEADHA